VRDKPTSDRGRTLDAQPKITIEPVFGPTIQPTHRPVHAKKRADGRHVRLE
jgi:hypothetical protein